MNSQSPFLSDADLDKRETNDSLNEADSALKPPGDNGSPFSIQPSFWRDRLFEAALILSMTLYYVIGNQNLGNTFLSHINPLFSLPFLLLFAILCWYRLPFAVALFPLTLPYYAQHKDVILHFAFSLAEITLGVCLPIALLQFVWQRRRWPYRLSWQELRDRLGPFTLPVLWFLAVAAFSILIAYQPVLARRAFREEVLDPLLYVVLALYCLRSQHDVARLLRALVATGFIVALLGLIQYVFFKNTLTPDADGVRRVHAMYGSANSIGLLFDYTLPIGLAWFAAYASHIRDGWAAWKHCILALFVCLPMLYVLYLTQSTGAWVAIAVAALFIAALSIRSRKGFFLSTAVCAAGLLIALFLFRNRIFTFLFARHVDAYHISTTTKRLYLWQSAWNMIAHSPWFGYGMDNWLCHYSSNTLCPTPQLHHYMIDPDPVTHLPTDLRFEPDISHPHNVFLHIWVSMGIFGVLAFAVILILFFWLFVRLLKHLRTHEARQNIHLQWMTIGVGAAMLAAMVHGQVDSAFLAQDLAFCFWILVVALLLLRILAEVPWRKHKPDIARKT